MVELLKEIDNETEVKIQDCLSSSNISGIKLRQAHYFLGKKIGKQLIDYRNLVNKKLCVLIMMRAGLMFGLGVADQLESNNKVDVTFSNNDRTKLEGYDYIIIADAVINTGNTIKNLVRQMINANIIITTNVLSDKYIDALNDFDILTVRISSHSYTGTKNKTIVEGKGPDTGDRLFSNSFYD